MDIISIFLIGVGLAMDAFSVAVSDGIALKKPTFLQSVKISFFFGLFQFIMPCIGYLLGSAFASYIQTFDHWIAFILLLFVGGKMIFDSVHEENSEKSVSNPLSFSTLLISAIATSIDALAVGVTFATVSTPVIFASALIGIVTFAISLAGVFIGSCFGDLFGSKSETAGGIVLICIGVKILAEHLFF